MKTVNFIFGIHNHQPVGNFDFVFEDAYRQSYLPFIEVVEQFPNIHITLHFSGCLLEWLEKHYPDFQRRVMNLVKRGNVEILSGGFFEPVLAMIPDADKIGQIEMMNDYIRKRFGYEPKGLWLTERVWEPHLARYIALSGISYVTVDDYHFLSNGKMEHELVGHFITEEQGETISIFPINQKLRYAIPFQDPQVTIDLLSKYVTDDGSNVIVMADDGEKFGVWPGTHKTVFEEEWLYRFFSALEENSDWIITKTFAEYFCEYSPKGRIYLPTASYFEMSEWSLPWESGEKFHNLVHEFEEQNRIDEIRPYFKGGIWRNFLYKYDEANWMQKKMLHISQRLHNHNLNELKGDLRKKILKAQEHLWRGMCNCSYWHGIFGGLYLPHLRQAVYQELLKSERILDAIEYGEELHIEVLDIDCDGNDEIIMSNTLLRVVVAPARGAVLQELSLMDKSYNILNTLKRYRESYHKKVIQAEQESVNETSGSIHDMVVVKERGLDKYLKYDKYLRKTLVDHLILPSVNFEDFRDGNYYEENDFIEGKYEFEIDKQGCKVILNREGWINWQKFKIQKEIELGGTFINTNYTLENVGGKEIDIVFGPEFNFAMLGGDSPDRYYSTDDQFFENSALNSTGILEGTDSLSVVSEYDGFKIRVEADKSTEIWRFPIETVSLSEAGFERVYQSSVVIPWYRLKMKPQMTRTINVKLIISEV